MKTYKVNLDYESSLFDPAHNEQSSSSLKVVKEFEYVFFLINKENCALKNVRGYEASYLESLQKMGYSIPQLSPEEKVYDYWWGQRKDLELEKKLNSKLTSSLLAKEKNWGFSEGAIIESLTELYAHLERFLDVETWIIKRPHSFSGIGHYQFVKKEINETTLKKILIEKVLLEPVYNRIFDIGTTFIIEEGKVQRQFMVENFNSKAGGFKGGAGSSDVDKFKKYIFKKYNYSLDELEETTKKITRSYLDLGATSNIQIDSFVYEKDGQFFLYPLVEVNYRKTMGLVIQSLADKNPEASRIEWRVLAAKEISDEMNDWVKISPEGNHFRSFYKMFK